jgi:glutaminase
MRDNSAKFTKEVENVLAKKNADLLYDDYPELRPLFESLDEEGLGSITMAQLLGRLQSMGIRKDDPRLKDCLGTYLREDGDVSETLDFAAFAEILQGSSSNLIKRTIRGELVIPQFDMFCAEIREMYERTRQISKGNVATYIPQLGGVDPALYAVSVCTVDGQLLQLGDHEVKFCLQSVCKPINYGIALEERGETKVHQHVGREPSGRGFNGLVLNDENLPHNPMINAGAIMTCSLIQPTLSLDDRTRHVMNTWTRLSGNRSVTFDNDVYRSERETADRNFALGYYMREKGAFPPNTDFYQTMEFYFQCCSVELDSDALSVAAATLANAGVCPLTGDKVFRPDTVKDCLSLMLSCGMYDFSGEFAFTIGLPAKSGVAGGLMIVIPNLMGIAIYSPPLDTLGNPVRGIEFCKELVKRYNVHKYDSVAQPVHQKKDPSLPRIQSRTEGVVSLCWAASEGDLFEIQTLLAKGVSVDATNYDKRTALHLAAAEGHFKIVRYLLYKKADVNPRDRWGHTPLTDALSGGHTDIARFLKDWGAVE